MNPLISVITVCYNSEKTIERTIKSVLQQKFKDYEYIIVDGASTDGTLDVIKRYEPLFEERMHWKSEQDKGIYNAFNKGIMRSTGILTWLVNSDDYIEPNALEIIKGEYDKYKKNNYPIISFAANYVDINGNFLKKIFYNKQYSEILCRLGNAGWCHTATIIPKNIYNNFELYDEDFRVAADLNFLLRARKKNLAIFFIDKVITNMSKGGASSIQTFEQRKYEQKLIFKKTYPYSAYLKYILWICSFKINYYIKRKVLLFLDA